MRPETFPQNNEINEIQKAILELQETNSWEAMIPAMVDLIYLIKQKEQWCTDGFT